MSDDLPALATYQARLLELLYSDVLVTDAAIRQVSGPFAESLGPLDPTLIEVAATLTKTWGKLDQT